MRYALISDIHANLPALEAVLGDVGARPDVDAIRQSTRPHEFAEYLRTGGKLERPPEAGA